MNVRPTRPTPIHTLLGGAMLTLAACSAAAQQGYPPPPGPYPVGPVAPAAAPARGPSTALPTAPQPAPGARYDATTLFGAPPAEPPARAESRGQPSFVRRDTDTGGPGVQSPAPPAMRPPPRPPEAGMTPAPDGPFRPAESLPY